VTVLSIAVDDLFTVRVVKYLSTNPANKWANSYEFQSNAIGSESELLLLASSLVNFEIALHLGVVTFDRVLISTWEPDSVPYNPANFISSTLTGVGTRGGSGDALPLDKTFSVTRQAASGRFGHLFYRGVLVEGDTEAPAGKSVLTDRPAWQTDVAAALTSSGFEEYIGTTPEASLGLVMVNADGTQVRPVIALRAQGVSSVPTDHAWFNRTTGP
jgi:hypothetical protein